MTRASVLTPVGRSAIAVVGVEGPAATAVVDACFLAANGKPFSDQPLGAIRFGRWLSQEGEELVVVRRSEERVEIHCHGGLAAQSAVLASLAEKGVTSGDLSSFDSHRTPLSQAAWHDLRHASTERVAGLLLDQANGALDVTLEEILTAIEAGDTASATSKIEKLFRWRSLGEHLLTPWHVAVAGPPNVGKSSLINTLVGYERAIVFDQPGTTRDVVTATTAVRGWPVRLADTAGLHDTVDPIEVAGMKLAREAIRSAEVVVVVQEAGDSPGLELEAEAPGAVLIRVASKVDLVSAPCGNEETILTSVVTGQGIAELLDRLATAIVPVDPLPGVALPFRSEHYTQLAQAGAAIEKNDLAAGCVRIKALLAGRG